MALAAAAPLTQQRILDAMFGSVERFGLSRVTVEDVAHRAGVSRQTVYRYFPSKEHLVMALLLREEEAFLDGVRTELDAASSLREGLERAVTFVLEFARSHPLLERLLATDQAAILPYLTTKGLPVIVRAREALVEMLREVAKGPDSEELRMSLDVTTRALVSYILSPSDRSDAELARSLANVVVGAAEGKRRR